MQVTICHLYGGSMNVYGDRGNVIALVQRARWRGIDAEVLTFEKGDRPTFSGVDLFFFGGGQDKEQGAISQYLQGDVGKSLIEAVEAGAALLSVCGGYQLLGQYFLTGAGDVLPGISLFDAHTTAGKRRFIGDVIVECRFGDQTNTLVGFENHSGQTFLGSGCRPLGAVLTGFGNNGSDRQEGAMYRNAFGTYLHGALLPKNPWFADYLLRAALMHRYATEVELAPLDDSVEYQAHDAVISRVRHSGRRDSSIHRH